MPSVDLPMSADNLMQSGFPTTNNDTGTNLGAGENNAGVDIWRSWVKPDFSSLPADAIFESAILKLTPINDLSGAAATMEAHRCLRAAVSNQMTWNIYSTGNNWGTAGASNSSTDYEGSVTMGSMTQPASPTLNVALEMTLSAAELQKLFDGTYTNNGIVLFTTVQSDNGILYASTNHGTAAYRPIITLTYSTGNIIFFS